MKIIMGDFLMLFSVVTIVVTLVFITQGWTLDKGSAQQTGLVQFASKPTGATVEVDQTTLYAKTNTKANVLPGEHEFKVWREGYETWYRKTSVNAGQVLWLNYTRLVPRQKTIKTFNAFENLKQTKVYPNQEEILALNADANGAAGFSVIDIKSDTPKISTLNIPSELFTLITKSAEIPDTPETQFLAADQISIESFTSDNNHVLLKQTVDGVANWILVDLDRPNESQNLTREFNLNFDQMIPISDNGSKILVRTGTDLRQVNTTNKTVSAILVDSITHFETYGNDVVGYIQKQKDSDKYSAGIFKLNETPVIVKKDLVNPKIAVASYYSENYLHVLDGKNIYVLKSTEWPTKQNTLKLSQTITLPFEASVLQVNQEDRIIMASLKNDTFVYDLETDKHYDITTDSKSEETKKITWFDSFVIYGFNDGQLTIHDFDGANKHPLMDALEAFPATFSSNNKYVYAIQATEDGKYTLAQLKMIID